MAEDFTRKHRELSQTLDGHAIEVDEEFADGWCCPQRLQQRKRVRSWKESRSIDCRDWLLTMKANVAAERDGVDVTEVTDSEDLGLELLGPAPSNFFPPLMNVSASGPASIDPIDLENFDVGDEEYLFVGKGMDAE